MIASIGEKCTTNNNIQRVSMAGVFTTYSEFSLRAVFCLVLFFFHFFFSPALISSIGVHVFIHSISDQFSFCFLFKRFVINWQRMIFFSMSFLERIRSFSLLNSQIIKKNKRQTNRIKSIFFSNAFESFNQ